MMFEEPIALAMAFEALVSAWIQDDRAEEYARAMDALDS